jgi:chorismate mutase
MRALRGATTVARDDSEEIVAATRELVAAMLERNAVAIGDIVSIVFTATPDLTAEFPAVAARSLGLDDVPLLCAAEMAVPGSVPRCIRVLLHFNSEVAPGELKHVYLRDARSLRQDLDQD